MLDEGTAVVEAPDDVALAERLAGGREQILSELRKIIIGQDEVVEQVLLTLFVGGNSLLLGVPGLAKTLLIHSIAQVLDLDFSRIQFTPDLMPSDITGTEVLASDKNAEARSFRFLPGPIFANIILADEINRTPPKTQAALMEAMEERQVTSVGHRYPLPDPFFVLATQNPIEQEGTYPLPAAQLDRFMFRIRIEYPEHDVESRVARKIAKRSPTPLEPVLGADDIRAFGDELTRVQIAEPLRRKIVSFVRRTRPDEEGAPEFIREWVAFGASPRAAQALSVAARARALLRGRTSVNVNDVLTLAPDIIRHRLVLNYHATAEGVRGVDVVRRLMAVHFETKDPAGAPRRSLWKRLLNR